MNQNIVELNLGGATLYQFANRSPIQMMSYLIETAENRLVMIDGGNCCKEDGMFLYDKIKSLGGRVEYWFITHAHDDHFGALLWMLENKKDFDIKIEHLVFKFPPTEWFLTVENGNAYKPLCRFLDALKEKEIVSESVSAGDVFSCDDIIIEALNNCDNYANYRSVNDTSIVLLAHFPEKDVLFLSDLAVDGEKELLKVCKKEKLRCDIVQMAHHGQQGTDFDFYKIVEPKICLYTAPDWLWDNDTGTGKNTGPFKTLQTREWMENLGAYASFPLMNGDYIFR